MTTTVTGTKTFQRLELIITQYRVALRRLRIPMDDITRIERGLRNRWISEIKVYAMDSSKLCRGMLVLAVDWDEYDRQIARGKATVTIDERWTDSLAIELDEALKLFSEFVSTYSLTTIWQLSHPRSVTSNPAKKQEVMRNLNLVDADTVKWAPKSAGSRSKIPELSEFSVGTYLDL